MNGHLLALYVAAVFLAMIAPGPDMMFVLATGARGGPGSGCWPRSERLPARSCRSRPWQRVWRRCSPQAPAAFTVLRACGAAYLLYLGIQALRSARRGGAISAAADHAPVSGRYAYLRGFLTNLVNPKMVTFAVAFLPQFVDRGLGHVPLQFAVLGVIFVAFEVLVDGTVGLTAGRLGSWLSRRRRARQALDAGSGTIMVVLAGRLALEAR